MSQFDSRERRGCRVLALGLHHLRWQLPHQVVAYHHQQHFTTTTNTTTTIITIIRMIITTFSIWQNSSSSAIWMTWRAESWRLSRRRNMKVSWKKYNIKKEKCKGELKKYNIKKEKYEGALKKIYISWRQNIKVWLRKYNKCTSYVPNLGHNWTSDRYDCPLQWDFEIWGKWGSWLFL